MLFTQLEIWPINDPPETVGAGMFDAMRFASIGLGPIYEKTLAGERLDYEEGLKLFACQDVTALGALALHRRCQLHQDKVHYVVNRQINYTNICVNGCDFCSFRRSDENEPGAFCLSQAEILRRAAEMQAGFPKLDELHLVGGCHPGLPLVWFESLLTKLGQKFPEISIKAFSPVEVAHLAALEGISTHDVLLRLKKAGLVMLAAGDTEIFDTRLRENFWPRKASASQWLSISGEAHSIGLKSSCSMLYGHMENYEQRLDHLLKLRSQQDESGGFICFIPMPFLKKNGHMELPPQRRGPANAADQLKTIAISRLMLDNIAHIRAHWFLPGPKMAQAALWHGADDLDGVIIEESVCQTNADNPFLGLNVAELEQMIKRCGFTPVRRNAVFDAMPYIGETMETA